jgi:hypothetical protein
MGVGFSSEQPDLKSGCFCFNPHAEVTDGKP